ncbi:hypothetical protein PSHT_15811 [Puccinia striiformis]|uniref:Uncharacterized protein n=1 Tax=Puccinia striiformis TaxID=27350 RepID=A0A2S4UD17_9BASI|nr:hypothetical protein PSHT_15811 [Puccinia striiformis]
MPLSINFKATRGIIIVGHMAELDHDQIAQHFTPHVDNGRVMDALFSITKNEKKHLMETIYQTMKMLDVEVPGLRKCIRLLKKKITETSNNDEGLPLTQGEHDAFIKKLMARFDCEMPLYQSLSICVRIPMVSTRGDCVWIGFNAHQGPSGLMVAEDHSSKFYMNFWARSGDKPINVLSYQERADLDQD